MPDDRVRIAFVGAGTVTSGPHSQAVARCDAAELAGVFDPLTERAAALVDRHGGRLYPSFEALTNDADVDAVVVAAPTSHQADLATACLHAGKHVLIEKPIAESREEIDRLVTLAEETGLVAMPAHNFIYQASLAKGRDAVRAGRFGHLGSAWILYNIFHEEEVAARYPGVLRQIGTHLAYSLLYLIGRPRRVQAAASSVHYEALDREDQVLLTCEMPDGALANLWASFVADDATSDPWTMIFKILGTNGSFVYSWNEAQFADPGGPAWGVASYTDGFAAELDFFVRRAIGAGESPLSTLREARDSLCILEAAEHSLARAGAFVDVDYS